MFPGGLGVFLGGLIPTVSKAVTEARLIKTLDEGLRSGGRVAQEWNQEIKKGVHRVAEWGFAEFEKGTKCIGKIAHTGGQFMLAFGVNRWATYHAEQLNALCENYPSTCVLASPASILIHLSTGISTVLLIRVAYVYATRSPAPAESAAAEVALKLPPIPIPDSIVQGDPETHQALVQNALLAAKVDTILSELRGNQCQPD